MTRKVTEYSDRSRTRCAIDWYRSMMIQTIRSESVEDCTGTFLSDILRMSIANSHARSSNPAVESKVRKNSDGDRSEGDNILANASLFTSMLDWSTQRPFGTLRFLSAARCAFRYACAFATPTEIRVRTFGKSADSIVKRKTLLDTSRKFYVLKRAR